MASERERAIDELLQGRNFAFQLKSLLQGDHMIDIIKNNESQDLLLNVLNSFTNTLSIFNPPSPSHRRKFEDSGDSCKTSSSATKAPRGCYKRRKTSHSWTKDSPDLVDDGNAWRKYGQKLILKAKYPRNYYRCTHKYDQGCEAKKQVQRIEEEPPLYRTIYNGNHTCKIIKDDNLFIDYQESDANDSSILLSFNTNQDYPFFTTPSKQVSLPMKQEEDGLLPYNTQINQTSSSSDYLDQAVNNSSSCITSDDHDEDYSFNMDHLMIPSDIDQTQFDHDDVFVV
ncbi:WRKY DNA-binding transcription factor 70 [Euphorbia peplus]|nr:WRKY DNA-binding transcription factor 70 [Euphorbia peplus]